MDVLVELLPDHLTFRNFITLADFLEELYGRKVDLLTVGGIDPLIRQDVESEVVEVKVAIGLWLDTARTEGREMPEPGGRELLQESLASRISII